ncbi:MAG: sugar ABC transporter permease [Lachnospiraceae bacterium]|nr:sugar ABC transporter permease [Lachnospiraceae bacterium]
MSKKKPQNAVAGIPQKQTWWQSFIADFAGYKKQYALVLMFIPVVVYFAVFKYIPMGGIVMAFKDYKIRQGIWGSDWCGLENFTKLFATNTFARAVENTLEISLLRIICGFPVPIILALLLNEVNNEKFKKAVQTITYLPHFISWVVLAGLFQQLLSPSNGAVNSILGTLFNMEPIYFLGDNDYFRGTLIVTDIWKGAGWASILYLAAISGIDPSLYEAAKCDGATKLQCTRYITLPCIAATITVMLILEIGGILDAGFDQVFNLYNSAVYETADIIDTYVYRYGIGEMKYAMGTAVGLFKNGIGFILVLGTNAITKRINGNGIW